MADNRTQQWRAAKRKAGLKAVTVWLTTDEERFKKEAKDDKRLPEMRKARARL